MNDTIIKKEKIEVEKLKKLLRNKNNEATFHSKFTNKNKRKMKIEPIIEQDEQVIYYVNVSKNGKSLRELFCTDHNKNIKKCGKCYSKVYCRHDKLYKYCKKCDGSQLCKQDECINTLNKLYDGFCINCCVKMAPEKIPVNIPAGMCIIEYRTIEFIVRQFPELVWGTNRFIDSGVSRSLPDLFVQLEHITVIIEIDENSHKYYGTRQKENDRMIAILRENNYKPTVFLRFNPDKYTNASNEKILSCWDTIEGVRMIVRMQEWNKRLNYLKERVEYWIGKKTIDGIMEIEYLFYDHQFIDNLPEQLFIDLS